MQVLPVFWPVLWMEVSWLNGEKIELPFALDASVYAWNREAVHTLKENGTGIYYHAVGIKQQRVKGSGKSL